MQVDITDIDLSAHDMPIDAHDRRGVYALTVFNNSDIEIVYSDGPFHDGESAAAASNRYESFFVFPHDGGLVIRWKDDKLEHVRRESVVCRVLARSTSPAGGMDESNVVRFENTRLSWAGGVETEEIPFESMLRMIEDRVDTGCVRFEPVAGHVAMFG